MCKVGKPFLFLGGRAMLGSERENKRVIEKDQKQYLITQQLLSEEFLRA